MKKKILLIIGMFLFMSNVSALTFNVGITNIKDKGNNGTIGSIEKINMNNKSVDVFFQDIDDEVSFEVTIKNGGNKAGALKEINVTGTNDKIEYTTDLPEGGIAIDAEGENKVIITARVKQGATNGKTSSTVTIKYKYDEGSCPDGEILSSDESMCLCPNGLVRNEKGTCSKPDKEVECADDEVYNTQTKQCEKKVTPVNPDDKGTTPDKKDVTPVPNNPKTLDNIILITLLFMVSGLGIYAVMFKKLKTNKKKVAVGVITGVLTLSLSFTVLASVFGLDNLLTAIVNPITKTKEITLTVNEEIELIETWDGTCSLSNENLTPDKIFEGGSGTEADPYQIKTADQLACFAKSVNNGNSYANQNIKQIKNIKLNDKVLENVESNDVSTLNQWTSIGQAAIVNDTRTVITSFNGTYNGGNNTISGMYINNNQGDYLGLFGVLSGTVKNLNLSDSYINGHNYIGTLVASAEPGSVIENVKTYGKLNGNVSVGGIMADSAYTNTVTNYTKILNSENHSNITARDVAAGIGLRYANIIGSKNYGNVTAVSNASGIGYYSDYIIDSENHGDITGETHIAGISPAPCYAFGTDNYGKITGMLIDGTAQESSGYVGLTISGTAYDCNNYGDIETTIGYYAVGLGINGARFYNCGNTGTITAHDYTMPSDYNSTIYFSAMFAGGSTSISEASLSSDSNIQLYHDIIGNNFVSRNTNTYNSGDIYVSNITAKGFGVTMMGNSGAGNITNAHNTGNMYISNLTATGTSSAFTMIGTDGGTYTDVSSIGDMIIDNLNTENDTYIVGVGVNGSTVINARSEGTIEVKNSSLGSSKYIDSEWGGYYSYSYPFISGGTTGGAYMQNSSTKGEIIVHDNSFPAGLHVGLLSGSGAGAEKSFSERSMEIYNNSGNDLFAATLATSGGRGITDSYNRGNINIHDNSFTSLYAGNRTGGMNFYGGNYNSGDIYVNDNYATTMELGGYSSGPFFNNFYNLGNITFETSNNTRLTTLYASGINIMNFTGNSNLVNTGNITIPYVSSITNLAVGGVFARLDTLPVSSNIYNLGTISIGEGYTYSENINYGNIYGIQTLNYDPSGVTPTAYYTNDGYAMGLSRSSSSYAAIDTNYGTKIDASQAPSILSIINVNDAFEIKEGESLPTLKVFNQ